MGSGTEKAQNQVMHGGLPEVIHKGTFEEHKRRAGSDATFVTDRCCDKLKRVFQTSPAQG